MVLLSLASAFPSCRPVSLFQHPWVTSSPLSQSAMSLLSSWAQVEPRLTLSLLLCSATPVLPVLLAESAYSDAGEKMAASPLNPGVKSLPAEQFSPGPIDIQMAVVSPIFWMQEEPGWTPFHMFWHSSVPCAPDCTHQLSQRREDAHLSIIDLRG